VFTAFGYVNPCTFPRGELGVESGKKWKEMKYSKGMQPKNFLKTPTTTKLRIHHKLGASATSRLECSKESQSIRVVERISNSMLSFSNALLIE